jgi:ABC-2 type transport system permease protein
MMTNNFSLYTTALNTLIRKEVDRFLRIWTDSLLPPVITMALYFIIFGHLIGPRIGEIDGIPYIQFIAPGLIMMPIINSSFANVAFSLYLAKFGRNIEELLVAPVPNIIVLLGYTIGGSARGLLTGFLVTLVTLFFTNIHIYHPFLMLVVVISCSALFSIIGFINAIYAKSFDDVSLIPTFILTPLTFLGGMFYSIKILPPVWQNLSLLNPILYIINLFRYSLLNVSDVNIYVGLALLLGFFVILFFYALWLLKHGVNLKA